MHNSRLAILNVRRINLNAQQGDRACRRDMSLAAVTFCPRHSPAGPSAPPFFRLGALAVDDRGGSTCLPAFLLAHRHIERVMDRSSVPFHSHTSVPCTVLFVGKSFAAPSIGTPSTARKYPVDHSRIFTVRLPPPRLAGGMTLDSAHSRPSDRCRNSAKLARRQLGAPLSTRRGSFANQCHTLKSPITTQQVIGSALSKIVLREPPLCRAAQIQSDTSRKSMREAKRLLKSAPRYIDNGCQGLARPICERVRGHRFCYRGSHR